MSRNPTRSGKVRPVQVERLESRALLTLFPGNPISPVAAAPITATGTADVTAAIANFKTAIGGVDNANTPSPQTSGFRQINWDAVALDGTDFGGGANTTVIDSGKTVGIPQNRFETRGVFFETIYAVSGDGFSDVNPAAADLFPAFSAKNTFAMFNDNSIDFNFVAPRTPDTAPVPAATRGFGAVFINSQIANTSSIEYFHGDQSLGKVFVPVGTKGQPEFVGELFDSPVVTRISLTLGTDTLFSFDGKTFTPGGSDGQTHNLVVTDDFIYPEPVPLGNLPLVGAGPAGPQYTVDPTPAPVTVGVPFTGTVATISSSRAAATAADLFAQINWGDGHQTNGVVKKNAQGGFDISGTNTYASTGLFPVTVSVFDLAGGQIAIANSAQVGRQATTVTLTSSANPVVAGRPVTFTANVSTVGTSPGTVSFFDNGGTLLGTSAVIDGSAKLMATLAAGSHQVTAVYNGDATTLNATSAAVTQVVNPDVTSAVKFAITRIRRRGQKVVEHLRITNSGSDPIGGPLVLVLDNLSSNAKLTNGSGTTKTLSPLGSPFLVLVPGTGTALNGGGATFEKDLAFLVKRGRLNFTLRLLSGVAAP